jgi:outer membrane protein assembly factor BamB
VGDPYRDDAREDRSILVVAFGGNVFGIDPVSGAIEWERKLDSMYRDVEIQIAHGRVFAATATALHAFDYPSGKPLGVVKIPDQYKGRPTMVLERDRIYIGSAGEVTCFSLEGTVLWMQGFEGKGMGGVALGFPGNVRQADAIGSR